MHIIHTDLLTSAIVLPSSVYRYDKTLRTPVRPIFSSASSSATTRAPNSDKATSPTNTDAHTGTTKTLTHLNNGYIVLSLQKKTIIYTSDHTLSDPVNEDHKVISSASSYADITIPEPNVVPSSSIDDQPGMYKHVLQ